MYSTGPYSRNVMTRVLLGLGPPTTHHSSHEDPTPSWEERVCGQSLTFAEHPSALADIVIAFDRQPVGWLPPIYPLSHPHVGQSSPSTPIPTIPDPPKFDTLNEDGYPDVRQDTDSTSPVPSDSTSASSTFTRSPSTRESSPGPAQAAKNEKNSSEPSPILFLREKERKKIRQSSGVKPKAKAPKAKGPRSADAAPSFYPPLETVQCQWAGCTKRLHVDYVSVKHWGKHIRQHYARQQDMVECRWGAGCDAVVSKSSMWKHVVVHQPKFKIRCPRGCDVMTRGDMMRRHLRSCPFNSGKAAAEGGSEEEDTDSEEGAHGDDYEGDGEYGEGSRED